MENSKKGIAGMILALAWPTMMEQVMQTAVQYVDTAMVGTLGTDAVAAVGATSTVGWLIYSTISAFGVGFLALIAQACGAKEKDSAKHAAAQAAFVVLLLGIVSTVIPVALSRFVPVWMQVEERIQDLSATYFMILYLPMLPRTASAIFGTALRAAGDTKTPMKVGIIVNLLNVVLNFLLIYPTRTITFAGTSFTMIGAGLGVIGAAVASAISYVWGGVHITIVLWNHPRISPRGGSFRPDPAVLRPCWKITLPNMLQQFGTCLGFVAFAAMINSLGGVATAAHTIANTVESAFYIPAYGMQTAAATLTGNAYGARDNKQMRSLAAMFIPIEETLMIISGAALFFSAPHLMSLFSESEEVIRLGSTVLRMVAVSEPFYGFSIIVEGMHLGVGRTRTPFLYNVLGMWCVRIVGTFLLTQVFGYGLVAAWACMIAHNLLVFTLYLIAFIRGSWNPLNSLYA